MQNLIGDDGIVHAHAAFIKDAHDGLTATEVLGETAAEKGVLR